MTEPGRNTEPVIQKSAQDARAGATPHVTRYVLGWGLALVVIAFAVLWIVYYN